MATGAGGVLGAFNVAGILAPADVHVATRLGVLGGEDDPSVLLAAALAVRAPRLGHVRVDLATVAATAAPDLDGPGAAEDLPWPGAGWVDRVAASPLVGDGRPLHLEGTALYLDRYRADECRVAADLLERAESGAAGVDVETLRRGLTRLFGPAVPTDLQRLAAASAVLRRLGVIAGGPGTGKTTTVARILALIDDQAAASGGHRPSLALAAPTGKGAARLQEAVHLEAARLPVDESCRARLLAVRAMTLHRLLGWTHNRTRFAHHRLNRLPHDVVVVDETSMVSLPLMARLVEAVRTDARLILVGDPEQLASVEAGAVLGDLVGPAARGLRMRPEAHRVLAVAADQPVAADAPPLLSDRQPGRETPIGDGMVVLRRVHRFGGAIAALAEAIQLGDADATVSVLAAGHADARWLDLDLFAGPLDELRAEAVAAGRRVVDAARAGRAADAIAALGSFRVLCAHRHGPAGAAHWKVRVERWLAATTGVLGAGGSWYAGRPLLMTANDYGLRLYNGDTGVVLASGGGGAERLVAVFPRGADLIEVSPTRLAAVETAYALTVHKAQGSQFDAVAVLLPNPESPLLTRELLYTAVTRARSRVTVVGTEAAIRAAVGRPIARSSGLGPRLWGPAPPLAR